MTKFLRFRTGALARLRSAAAALLFGGVLAFPAAAVAQPAIEAVPIGSFADPVHVAAAPGYPQLLFVVERAGQVRVMRNERKISEPFLDIRNIVLGLPDAAAGGEQGLLSIAFPPNYQNSGRFYVFFTNRDGDLEIDEFRRAADNSVRADRSSGRTLLVIPHRGAQNHNGGQLKFGPDGFLYISTGDGGRATPRGEPARHLNNLLGKILRIDPRPDGARPYRVPASNPFVERAGRDEIFAYGLRNPWRFAFDGPRLAIGDVGYQSREEVNLLPAREARGANFGWPQFEGDIVHDRDRPGPHRHTPPIHAYSHAEGGCSIIGGYVVRDADLPSLEGRYLYTDFCTGDLRSFLARVDAQEARGDRSTGLVLPRVTSFGEGLDGRIYIAQNDDGDGRVLRLQEVDR